MKNTLHGFLEKCSSASENIFAFLRYKAKPNTQKFQQQIGVVEQPHEVSCHKYF